MPRLLLEVLGDLVFIDRELGIFPFKAPDTVLLPIFVDHRSFLQVAQKLSHVFYPLNKLSFAHDVGENVAEFLHCKLALRLNITTFSTVVVVEVLK